MIVIIKLLAVIYFIIKLVPVVCAKASNKANFNSVLDALFGTEECRPLFRLFWEALLSYQNKDYTDSLETIFQNLIEKDDISAKLFADINKHCPAMSNSINYRIRIALLVLDSEISHQLIFILTGIESRGLVMCANYLAKDLFKIIYKFEAADDTEEGYLSLFLKNEIVCMKSSFKRLGFND
jgi:hypothetical protein